MTHRRHGQAQTPPGPRLPRPELVTRQKATVASDDIITVNCGRCGRALRLRSDEIRGLRTVDCLDCIAARAAD